MKKNKKEKKKEKRKEFIYISFTNLSVECGNRRDDGMQHRKNITLLLVASYHVISESPTLLIFFYHVTCYRL